MASAFGIQCVEITDKQGEMNENSQIRTEVGQNGTAKEWQAFYEEGTEKNDLHLMP